MRKVLVLGIDGGSLDLIKQWKNDLPNLRVFLENGVYGTLESTLPPLTSPAWNCMFTGKNPAKIGFYDFFVISFDENRVRMVNSTYQDPPSIWETLSDFDVKVGIVNVPSTFPPRKVNGFMVCGGVLNALLKDVDYTYPSALAKELNEVVEGYEILPLTDLFIEGKEAEYFYQFNRLLEKQVSAVQHLMKTHPWNFFVYVFFETDSVQHYFWHHMDQHHPKWNPEKSKEYENSIKDFYVKVDTAIGKLLNGTSAEANIILVSDHGFGPLHGYFCVNEWLKRKGYLKMKPQKRVYSFKNGVRKILQRLTTLALSHSNPRFVENFMNIIPVNILQKFSVRGRKKYECDRLFEDIDWSQTKAYGLRMNIFINLKGRDLKGIIEPGEEYEKLRDEIIESLRQIRDPKTGRKLVTQVFKKEDVYFGKHLDSAPDLIYLIDNLRYRPIEGTDYGKLFIEPILTGEHRLQGMFMAYGPDIKKTGEEIQNIKIYDVTPTILHMFGIPISEDIDGRVLKEIFENESELAKMPIVRQSKIEKDVAEHEVFGDEDEQRIKEKLRRLGYL